MDGSGILNRFPNLVLFDFDGTLADSYPAITASVNHTREAHGLPPVPKDEVKRFVGRGPEHLLGNMVPGVDYLKAYEIYKAHHPTVLASGTVLLPGVLELLADLLARGVSLGICSNKPRAFTEELVECLRLGDTFAMVLGPEDVARRKPAPDMLIEAVKRSGLSRDRVLYVGDMSVDVQTARGAGVTVWAVASGSETEQEIRASGPDQLFGNMMELHAGLLSKGFEPNTK